MTDTGYTTDYAQEGLVSRDESGHAHIYLPSFSQDALEREMALDEDPAGAIADRRPHPDRLAAANPLYRRQLAEQSA